MTGHPQSPSRVEQDLIALAAKYDKLASGYEKVTAPPQETIAEYRLIASALRSAATPPQADREMARAQLRRFHRSSCYPDAMDIEVDLALDAILAALSLPARASEWLPIETCVLPPQNKEQWYLTVFSCLGAKANYFLGEIHYGYTERGKGRWTDARGRVCEPSFWQPSPPLPAPPITANSRGGAE